MPQDVQTQLECETGLLNISWYQPGEAHNYHATVTSSEGQMIVCSSDEPTCLLPNLPCGLNYSMVVVAHNNVCNSSLSPVQQITAGENICVFVCVLICVCVCSMYVYVGVCMHVIVSVCVCVFGCDFMCVCVSTF